MKELGDRERADATDPWIRRVITVILLVPAVWLIAFASLVLRTRIALGAWPSDLQFRSLDDIGWEPALEDMAGFEAHVGVVGVGLFVTAPCVLIGVVLLLIGVAEPRLGAPRSLRTTFGITAATCVALVALDPGHLLEWFLS